MSSSSTTTKSAERGTAGN